MPIVDSLVATFFSSENSQEDSESRIVKAQQEVCVTGLLFVGFGNEKVPIQMRKFPSRASNQIVGKKTMWCQCSHSGGKGIWKRPTSPRVSRPRFLYAICFVEGKCLGPECELYSGLLLRIH